jgi:choline dehydrogenase-like flavoprotein
MLIDLCNADPGVSHVDVAIVGGGIAGLLIATRLAADKKMRVAVLESGGLRPQSGDTPEVLQLGKHHTGALIGRERCLGGTSVRWGGKMIPFLGHDLLARPHLALPSWPVRLEDLLRYLPDVERLFCLDKGTYDDDGAKAHHSIAQGNLDLVARYEKLPSFKRRNLRILLDAQLRDPELGIFVNSTVTDFVFGKGRIAAVKAVNASGKTLTVHARHFVIAAGAIESTRLLLNMDRQHGVFADCEVLGGYFFDHLSMTLGEFEDADGRALNRFAAHRFVGSSLRGSRLELTANAQAEDRVASAYGYIDFDRTAGNVFENVRDLLRGLQGGSLVNPALLPKLATDLPYLAAALYWRFRHKQMLWPSPATYVLRVIAEQLPIRESRVGLATRSDRFGVPLTTLNWKLSDVDRQTFRCYADRFAAFWERGQQRMGRIRWEPALLADAALDAAITDFYHPGGSTRMGRTRRSAVVDENLRTFAVPNLWIASTSVFPSGASANPTLMLMLMAYRLADELLLAPEASNIVLAAA